MRKFGLIGYPLGHSFSKKYFSDKFVREEISDCSYENFPLTDISLFPDLVLNENDLVGLNVTIPYKSDIIGYLDSISQEASEIGAVNVIKFIRTKGSLTLHGFNSDITGIRDSLSPYVTPVLRTAIVLGTGGSSRSVCHVLNKLGINIIQVSRNRREGIISYSDITPSMINNAGLIVNTTPLGMFPQIKDFPDIDYNILSDKHILFDLVYNPEITTFLRKGAEMGCTVIGGLKMLHSQAERAWEIWNSDTCQLGSG
jgi:shikimate dehydrogenase